MIEIVKVPLSNIVLDLPAQLSLCPEVVYRASGAVDYSADSKSLAFEGKVDFLTYLNALSWGKWRKYTFVDRAALHIELAGDPCTLQLTAMLPEAVGTAGVAGRFTKRRPDASSGSISPAPIGGAIEFGGSGEFARTGRSCSRWGLRARRLRASERGSDRDP